MKIVVNGRTVDRSELPNRRKRFESELRSGKCAGIRTDDNMLSGFGSLEKQVPCKRTRDQLIQSAMRQGYKPKPTDVYMPTLVPVGGKPGHPDAWLSHSEGGRSKIKRVLEDRGVETGGDGVDGWVKTKGRDLPPAPKVRLAKDIQERIYNERVSSDPGLSRKDKREVLESIVEDHGSPD